MKNTKKILGVVLAVVMALSALSMAAYAAISVTVDSTENPAAINVKLEVTQVAEVADSVNAEPYEAVDNDIYAVTIFAKTPATYGLYTFRTCLKYDDTKFQPMMSYDGADLLVGEDYYDETGEKTSLFVKYGAQFSDGRFFDADGNVVTKASQATTIGLGKTAAGTVLKSCNIQVQGEDPYYSDDYGVMFCETLFQPKNKGAYQNAIDGKLSSDYVEIMTVYFQRQVDEDAVYGSEFGIVAGSIATGENDNVIGAAGGAAGYSNSPAHVLSSVTMNFVANAVEAAIKPIATLTGTTKSQGIMFNLAEGATPAYSADDVTTVDYRFVVQFSKTAFPINSSDNYATFTTDIDEVGFVMTRTDSGKTASDLMAADIATLEKDSGDIRKCWTEKISTDASGDAAFVYSCRIKGIPVTAGTVGGEYLVVPYIVSAGSTTYGAPMTSDVQGRYNTYIGTFLAKANS